ncbi:cupin domain-containing protein [Paenibacillus sp. CC-CFT747]|nr:cupin domain-containing protein [Paenibacillus sp. CC-CFT747]
MSRIAMVEAAAPIDLPSPVIRADLAWALFWPETRAGSLPNGGGNAFMPLSRWLWESLGRVTGFMRIGSAETVWVLAPPCEPSARELLTRLLSFWSTEVYWVSEGDAPCTDFSGYENRWLPPVQDVFAKPEEGSVWDRAAEKSGYGEDRYLMPALGVGRVDMKVQVVNPGTASVELHSHSTLDEYYLVLSGRGTLRMASHRIPVGPGSLIAKPSGPDLTSQILADRNEPVVVLDIEAFTSPTGRKDVCVCPDENLMILQGAGWWSTVPLTNMEPIE